jgi:hypothetical protein
MVLFKMDLIIPQQQEFAAIETKENNLAMANIGLQQVKSDFTKQQTQVNALKADFAKETGYFLAVKLIDIVSELCAPDQDESLTSSHKMKKIDPWRWMTSEQAFRRVTDDNPQLLPEGINSVEEIVLTAAIIKTMHQGKKYRTDPEQLCLELKSF